MPPEFKDYYKLLGVARTATPDEIKKAYRRLARKYHPDLARGKDKDDFERRFKEINEANQVLSDPEARKRYDALGANWKHGDPFPGGGGPGGGGPFTWTWTSGGGPAGGGAGPGGYDDFSDFFRSMFGGAGGAAGARGRGGPGGAGFSMRGEDVQSLLEVTLDEVLSGGQRRLRMSDGGGEQTVDVRVPPGVRDGGVLRIRGRGQPGMGGGPAGDLLLEVRVAPHPVFRRHGDDLETSVRIWPWEAVLGGEVVVPVLGGTVRMKVPPGAHAGQRMKLRGKGLPHRDGGRGDQYALLEIGVGERVSPEEKELYERLAALPRTEARPS